ncbi:LamG-like jellyroll fold domain-containing protein [Paenibacillus eucommiae]|uniref:LamG domain-containing protein n=1 Tax=Paenibacillus eucommiae TaxID=1355755 RepID=A0ABS4ITQ1_9BACL|nr:LamG-like jellyroll fold domain-containing protein [Paenibacillus eucommiae]MBP1990251.1 hypothetical protein [Paenibacillus eucommiae]
MNVNHSDMTVSGNRVGYWPLRSDSRDMTARARHGEAHNIKFEDGASFDGATSVIGLPGLEETDGSKPFSLSLEFEVNDERGFLPGGLCSRYSQERMEGWHLSVLSQPGVTTTQANWRNLQFGWSTGKAEDVWRDWGSPGNSRLICSLCVHDGGLYAGVFDDEKDGRGHVYRLDEDKGWIDCGSPDDSNSAWSMAEFNGRLYVGTMRYKASGSALPDSPNVSPGGRIFRYEGGQRWTLFGELPIEGSDSIGALTVYDGRLIAMSFYPYGMFAFDADGRCEPLGAPGPEETTRTMTLTPYRGRLYVGANQSAGVWSRSLHEPWINSSELANCDQVYCFTVYHNELLIGIWPEARMLQYEGGTDWSDYGLMGEEKEVMGVSVYNGKLYGGTLPGGHVYRYSGDRSWERIGVLEPPNPDMMYRRVWSMAVYNGMLFAGTLPSGKVWSLKNDPLATYDHGLSPGWHRAAITYDQNVLALYLDGRLVAESAFAQGDGALTPDQTLLELGNGPQCRFSGRIREVEIYDGALTSGDIVRLHSSEV